MVPAGNKAKRLSSVNHTTKTIHHHHHHSNVFISILLFLLLTLNELVLSGKTLKTEKASHEIANVSYSIAFPRIFV